MKLNIIITTIVCFALTSCSILEKKHNTNANELLYSKWKVVELNNKAVASKINGADHSFTFDKNENHYIAITGCNTLNGNFTASNGNIKFGVGLSTMMACQDMSLEQGLRTVFEKVTKYSISNNILVLSDDKNNIIAKLKLADQDNKNNISALKGNWELEYLHEPKKTFDALFPNQKPTLSFNVSEKTFSGSGSCNRYSGVFTAENNKLNFGAVASTRMACPTMDGELAYFKNLEKVNSFSIQENTLTFIMGDIAIMKFKRI